MRKKELIISTPYGNLKKVKALLKARQAKKWVYFGSKFSTLTSLEQQLTDGFICIDIIEIHKSVVESIKVEYVAWIDELNRKYGFELDWWLGSVFSRNNYTSDLFQFTCYLEILKRLLLKDEIFPDLVFVESAGFAKDLKNWAQSNGFSVIIKHGSFSIASASSFFKSVLDWLRFIVISIIRSFAAFVTRGIFKKVKCLPKSSTIIHTFIHDNSLTKDGILTDRYLPFLYDYAARNGLNIVIHPMLYGFKYSYLAIYRKMRSSRIPIIIKEDFLRVDDYLRAFTYPFRTPGKKIELKDFRSHSFFHSIREMRKKECFSPAMNAVLVYQLFLRLSKTEFEPAHFVLWFENQVMDKALIAGVRRFFPGARITGAQMFLHPPNLLSLFPSQSEVDARLVPDILIETSQYQCKRAVAFMDTIPCQVGAGLRYAHVFRNEIFPQSKGNDLPAILVVLPFNLFESIEILSLIKNSLGYIKQAVSVLIKVHPDCNLERIKKEFGELVWPEAFQVVTGSLADVLKKARIVISANSSSMVEAVSYGIPVIYAGSRIMMNQNILKDLDSEITQECYTPLELADAINSYIQKYPLKLAEYKEIGNKVKDMYFTPVSDKTLAPFFERTK